jgi:hypothetical protein
MHKFLEQVLVNIDPKTCAVTNVISSHGQKKGGSIGSEIDFLYHHDHFNYYHTADARFRPHSGVFSGWMNSFAQFLRGNFRIAMLINIILGYSLMWMINFLFYSRHRPLGLIHFPLMQNHTAPE